MMGRQPPYRHKFSVTGFNLDKRIRKNHVLRKISEKIDFDFIYEEVKDSYGVNGNVSVPPSIILKVSPRSVDESDVLEQTHRGSGRQKGTSREDWQLSKGAVARLCLGKPAHEGFRTLQGDTVLNMTDSYTALKIPIPAVPFDDNHILKQL